VERAPARPIVVGVDFSPESRHALAAAASFASALRAPVHLVTAVEPLLAEAARVQHQMPAYVDQVAQDLRAFAQAMPDPLERVSCEVLEGNPADQILAAADRASAQFIVVGTRGRGQAARLLLGSTTQRLLRSAREPVLVTPSAGDAADAPRQAPIRRLICGIDFSDGSLAALTEAHRMATALGAELHLVHAATGGDADVGARARLAGLIRERAPEADARVVEGNAADVLVREATATDAGASLIVVGLRGASQKRPGQTALAILATARVPVLAVP
jgi:nucleotide-binding universal stress UspA family protein